MSNKYTMYTDGGKRKDITYGSFKLFDGEKELTHHSMIFGFGSSNASEYLALINAIKFCNKYGYKDVAFYTDSLLVVKQISGEFRTLSKTSKTLKTIATEELLKLDSFSLNHVGRKEIKKILNH